ncbi:hypothetical protein [Actinokineospora diospyrosa]|uniref:Secreted protein n=1 Tax=Actinokineospora diospyrosa TaxID=103728 RepID=A0ABT1I5W4_9PSEU|nr:hypothetical protein [Actinokineospora diospyrosa]MCP2267964.1 hypothetical protein [Actinokineospora diospyrosa]
MTVAAFVLSCLGFAVAVLAAWFAHGQKKAAESAAVEAKRSADAAEAVAAVERERRAEEVADAARRRVVFGLLQFGGRQFALRNSGTDTAYGVHVDTGGLGIQDEVVDFEEFEAGHEEAYIFARTMNPEQASHIVVTWHLQPDRSDEPRTVRLLGP